MLFSPSLRLTQTRVYRKKVARTTNQVFSIHHIHTHRERTRVNLFPRWFALLLISKAHFSFLWEGGDSRNLFWRFIFLFWKYRRVFIISPLFWKSWPRRMVYFIARYRAFWFKNTREHVTLFVTIALIKDLYVNLDTISCAHESNIMCTHKKLTLKFVNTQVS